MSYYMINPQLQPNKLFQCIFRPLGSVHTYSDNWNYRGSFCLTQSRNKILVNFWVKLSGTYNIIFVTFPEMRTLINFVHLNAVDVFFQQNLENIFLIIFQWTWNYYCPYLLRCHDKAVLPGVQLHNSMNFPSFICLIFTQMQSFRYHERIAQLWRGKASKLDNV